MTEPLSNASDYDVVAGRRCPFCGNVDVRLIEPIRAGFAGLVCSRLWAAIPEKYRGSWQA